MNEFVPGVWYHPKGLSVTNNGVQEPFLLCYSPMSAKDETPFIDLDLVDRWAWPEEREAVVIYDPHPVRTEWAVDIAHESWEDRPLGPAIGPERHKRDYDSEDEARAYANRSRHYLLIQRQAWATPWREAPK